MARMLGLSRATILRLAKAQVIPSIVLPSGHRRFDPDAVRQALANTETVFNSQYALAK
jgi:excisionase family DNA binding protein